MAPTIYTKLRDLTENHVSSVVLQFLHPNNDNLTFLKMAEKCWDGFCNQMVCHFFVTKTLILILNIYVLDYDSVHFPLFRPDICPPKCSNCFHLVRDG